MEEINYGLQGDKTGVETWEVTSKLSDNPIRQGFAITLFVILYHVKVFV